MRAVARAIDHFYELLAFHCALACLHRNFSRWNVHLNFQHAFDALQGLLDRVAAFLSGQPLDFQHKDISCLSS